MRVLDWKDKVFLIGAGLAVIFVAVTLIKAIVTVAGGL